MLKPQHPRTRVDHPHPALVIGAFLELEVCAAALVLDPPTMPAWMLAVAAAGALCCAFYVLSACLGVDINE